MFAKKKNVTANNEQPTENVIRADKKAEKLNKKNRKSNNPPVQYDNKPEKLKKNTGLKIVRFLLWAILIFIFVRGTITLVKGDPIQEMKKSQSEFMKKAEDQGELQTRAFSFSEDFVKEYYTHVSNQDDNYRKRLLPFMNEELVKEIQSLSDTTVIEVRAYDIDKYSDNQYDVYACADVQYKLKDDKKIRRKVYLKIPIAYDNYNFLVEDFPNFVAEPNKGDVKNKEYDGEKVDEQENNEVKEVLNQFFKAYYSLPQAQVDYFLDSESDQSIEGIKGKAKFNKINKLDVYYYEDSEGKVSKDKYVAIVDLKVNDSANNSLLTQKYNIKVVKKDGKYYINELNTRSTNIREFKEKE